jgi:hypothetical protein
MRIATAAIVPIMFLLAVDSETTARSLEFKANHDGPSLIGDANFFGPQKKGDRRSIEIYCDKKKYETGIVSTITVVRGYFSGTGEIDIFMDGSFVTNVCRLTNTDGDDGQIMFRCTISGSVVDRVMGSFLEAKKNISVVLDDTRGLNKKTTVQLVQRKASEARLRNYIRKFVDACRA